MTGGVRITGGERWGARSELELESGAVRAASARPPAAVVAPEVHGLAAQRVGAAEAAFDPGAAGQPHLEPTLRGTAHRTSDGAVAVVALGRDEARRSGGRAALGGYNRWGSAGQAGCGQRGRQSER